MANNQAKKLYQKGLELLTYGKLSDAINYFREAVEADPSFIDAQIELGYLLGAMENYEDALNSFEKSLKIQETFLGYFGKGICLFFMEDYQKSLHAFENAKKFGENEDMWYYLGNLHLIYSGNYESAIDCLGNAISINDEFIEAWNDLGVAYSILEDDDNALLCFEESLKICDFGACKTEGFAVQETEFPSTSKSEISKALNIDPEFKPAIFNMGTTLADMGRYEDSLKFLDQTLESDPENFKALFYKGNVLYFMEKEEEAVEYFKKALKIDKTQEELWNYIGYIQFSIGQNHEAVESLNEAIKLNNDFEEAYMNLGNVYMSLGKYDLASGSFERVLEISPNNKEVLNEIQELKVWLEK